MTRLEAIKYIGGRIANLPKAVKARITETAIQESGEILYEFTESNQAGFYADYEAFLGTLVDEDTFFDKQITAMTTDEKNYLYTLRAEAYLMLSELHLLLKRYVDDSIFDKTVQFNSNEITPAYLDEIRQFTSFWLNKASYYQDKIDFEDVEEEASTGSIFLGAI
ncbi:MAG: hypothetical protein OMM_15099 [Candidatus Magnetoglobus multicellularis str. Araruama]|uniref:Uncharacterized protein n=1 Tax=Candidatus Magnetoglobus multicellularis str. Araruama TaxID=890399 RepID=A0A1V1NQS4_9BACT|nr:MAG: hypothetical protein OMM_15099 [Candidatus Magnetoglobus multicellularis str. Araruama]